MAEEFLIISMILNIICIILLIILMIKQKPKDTRNETDEIIKKLSDANSQLRLEISSMTQTSISSMNEVISTNQNKANDLQIEKLGLIRDNLTEKQDSTLKAVTSLANQLEKRLNTFSLETEQRLDLIKGSVEKRLGYLQEDNNKRLEEMRVVVDEKLQKTLDERMTKAFNLVNERLEQVHKGLGEMQTLAAGVGDLKKVLSNVKTRGIVGEIQLGAILEEILSPTQYEKNQKIKKNNFVEYAIKLPTDNGDTVYLPIDSKFPGDTYSALKDAYESGDSWAIGVAQKKLISTIKTEAKDIRDKYIDPPNTTEFAILFLPFEGLYAEVVNQGLVEILQRDFRVNIAGPSTMAALLNSLQMGFKSLAIQKHSNEVWKVLGEVKVEFDKFSDALTKTQQRLEMANDELNKLVGVRTRQMQKKLKNISEYEMISSKSESDTLEITTQLNT